MKRSGTPCIAISHRHISQAFSFSQLSASVSLSTEDLLRSHCHRIRSKLSFLELANYGKFAEISGATNHEFRIRPLFHIFSLFFRYTMLYPFWCFHRHLPCWTVFRCGSGMMDDVILGICLNSPWSAETISSFQNISEHSTTPCQDVSYAQWHRNGNGTAGCWGQSCLEPPKASQNQKFVGKSRI